MDKAEGQIDVSNSESHLMFKLWFALLQNRNIRNTIVQQSTNLIIYAYFDTLG